MHSFGTTEYPSLTSRPALSATNYGKGVNAYILDTGLRSDHEQLNNGGVARAVLLDGNWHVTHIVGTVAGFQSGVARQGKVFMIKVLDLAGSGTSTTVTNGLSKALTHQQTNFPGQPAVFSASLSGGRRARTRPASPRPCSQRSPRTGR